jgi:hypothetical protein
MKSYLQKHKLSNETIFFLVIVSLVIFFPELSYAENNSQSGNFKNFISKGAVKSALDFGLLFTAAYKWFSYFINWNPANAFLEVIVPGLMTFLAFNWLTVLGWFGLGG